MGKYAFQQLRYAEAERPCLQDCRGAGPFSLRLSDELDKSFSNIRAHKVKHCHCDNDEPYCDSG